MINPFIINGVVPEKYFCDGKKEIEKLQRCIYNQSNVLLTSPRRMGKTQLIRHLYQQGPISKDYHTFYVDIYPTTSLHEFILLLGKEVYLHIAPQGKKALDSFIAALKSPSGSFGYDALAGLPSFDVKPGDIRMPELTLSEILTILRMLISLASVQ